MHFWRRWENQKRLVKCLPWCNRIYKFFGCKVKDLDIKNMEKKIGFY